MEKYNKLKQEHLNSRKSKNILVSNLLGTLIGEIDTKLKEKGSRTHDEVVIFITKKFIKNLQLIDTDSARGEISILETYVPSELSESEVLESLKGLELEKLPNFGVRMGKAMGFLKGKAGGNLVTKVVKENYN